MDLLNPRIDLAFKKIFGSEENKDLLISFINSVVSKEDQVVDIELLNPYNSRNFSDGKLSILDVKAKDTLGNYYNIEVQICNEGDYDKRALYYWAKLYGDQISAGDPFKKLKKAIAIHILNFMSIPNAPKYCNRFIITNEETNLRYFNDLELYTIELSKFVGESDESLNKIVPRIKTGLDRWAAFLTKASKLNRNALPKELDDPYIKKAMDVLTHVSLNKEEREIYEGHLKWMRIEESTLQKIREEGLAEGKAEGLAEGLAAGKAENYREKLDIARDLLNQGMDMKSVCKITKVLKEDI